MESNWIDINDRLPDPGEYVLVSFENECITTVDIGTYRIDADGSGAFYHCDDDVSYATFGISDSNSIVSQGDASAIYQLSIAIQYLKERGGCEANE